MKKLNLTCIAVALIAAIGFSPRESSAQVGSTTDIIMGQVSGPEGQPISGARVEVTSTETQIKRTKTTGADGRYTIVFPDGGGSYAMTVTAIGYSPVRSAVSRQSDEDRLVADVKLGRSVAVLQSVEVRANPRPRQPTDRPEAGSTERGLNPALINRLPIEAGDLNTLATLAPGVIGVAATDSTSAAFSVAGQPTNQNSITLDGLSFGSGSVPQEAIRGTRVITNTYDVARGQFTGGQVATTTRGGTNVSTGALNYSLRDPSLEFAEEEENTFAQKYTQNQLSGGFGGPIIRDKLFAFGAASYTRRTDPLQSLLAADPLALQRIGASGDSVARFIGILNRYGLQPTSSLIPDERLNNQASAIVRFDYNLGESNTLMLRGDWRGSTQDASRISPFSVPHSGGDGRTSGGGGMLTLTSHWSLFINELRGYTSIDKRNTEPYLMVPSGRVIVASALDDGTSAVSTLQFGVNSSLPQESRSRLTEVSDEISRVSTAGGHRIKLGGLLNEENSSTGSFSNVLGTYTFNSLADFENGLPASFTRTLSTRRREARGINGALYLGDSWRKSPRLQLTYGTRLEMSAYPDNPQYNPVVDTVFGRRTDFFPSETHLSPRIGFTYNYGGKNERQTLGSIRGGIGEFRGRAPSQLFASAVDANGLVNGQAQLVCVGASVPLPDWPAFIDDPSLVPSSCNGPSQTFGNQRRNVTVFSPDFAAPRAWRSSLGVSRRFAERYNLSLDASYSRGVAQTSAIDLNLNTTPKFALATEQRRAVYTPVSTIVPTTGVAALAGSRVDPRFGVVTEMNSNLQSDTKQLTASLGGITTKAIVFNTSYTFMRSRDQQRGLASFGGGGFGGGGFGSGGGATTAGNPNIAEWATSDLERRHSLLATVTWPIKPAFELTAIGRLASGGFYTPGVSGDVNGDGLRNDRAFIFDPSSAPDTAIANGMSRLLASAPDRARQCIQSQLGNIANRNSCSLPWSTSFDLQANIKPSSFGLNRKLTISLVGLNTLSGIDQLLHGKNLHGWGQPAFADRTLLYVRGFDPAAQRYLYQVNEHFGAASGSRNAFRVPFQLSLQARLAIGVDPAQQQMRNVFGGGRGGRPSVEDFRQRLSRAVPNTFRQILELNDSLKLDLTDDQKAKLTTAGDSLQAKADTLIGALAQQLGNADKNGDPMQLGMRMRGRIQEGRKLAETAIADAEKILTPEQWAKVPKNVKEPLQGRGQGGEGGFRGPPDR
ncbi:MAG TPA: carboxypeptidase regulatory-like domain-containing protein [Gemmatimonadaceae bacterium]|nr:carboxypeptidase regulatory-like domain-containing protein [Gemmatimonadaceae bacterium]